MVDIKKARKNLNKAYEARKKRNLDRYNSAAADCRAVVDMIVAKYHPSRIIQWGSLLRPDRFKEYSDIDLAVEGIADAEVFFGLVGDAMRLTRFPLDIVQMEKIEKEFAATILKAGKVVYERT